jgi:hypothetical protein
MFQLRKRNELGSAQRGRRGIAIGATLASSAIAVLSVAGIAGATTTPQSHYKYTNYTQTAYNNLIIGSGSSTTYDMMQSLDTLFNNVPGCVITSGSVANAPTKKLQELNYACEHSTKVGTTTKVLEQVPGNAYLDNPINDVAVEEPPMGSSNGIAALELGRVYTTSTYGKTFSTSVTATKGQIAPINFARSSRTKSSHDTKGLQFVAYAKDGVAPFYFTEFGGTKTPQAKVAATLSATKLAQIFKGAIYDWGQLGSKTSEPIFVYSAQTGSGTQATMKTFLKVANTGTTINPTSSSRLVNCKDPVTPGTTVVATDKGTLSKPGTFEHVVSGALHALTAPGTCKGPTVIFENEDASILANAASSHTTWSPIAKAWYAEQAGTTGLSPVGNAIFFYSYGKFAEQCAGLKQQFSYSDKSKVITSNTKAGTHCGSVALPTGDKVTLAKVGGYAATPATIMGGTFPIIRYLNNVYSNGADSNFPKATAATLNYMSEVGFICKTQTTTGTQGVKAATTFTAPSGTGSTKDIVDPATGLWYHDEIFNAIIQAGFIPLDATVGTTIGSITDGSAAIEDAAAGTHTAYSILNATVGGSKYGATYLMGGTNHSISSASDPKGYCIVTDTTGNTAT